MGFGASIHWNWQFSKPGFFDFSNFIPKSNYNKLAWITWIDFFTISRQIQPNRTIINIFNNYFKYCNAVLYCDIFGSNMQVVLHILNNCKWFVWKTSMSMVQYILVHVHTGNVCTALVIFSIVSLNSVKAHSLTIPLVEVISI